MSDLKEFNLLFACTSDFFQYATVTALSAIENISENIKINVHFMYADIVKPTFSSTRKNNIEKVKFSLRRKNVSVYFHDVQKYMYLFENQPQGMWGKNISMTHYIYLLAPLILKNIDKVLYLDTDMAVNCDLSKVYFQDMKDYLITMAHPSELEDMGKKVSNSGFSILNLTQWRKENILEKLLEFGKNLDYCGFCDQYLLYQYFTLNNSDRLSYVDKTYNLFPESFPELSIDDIKIFHYTGYCTLKPWHDIKQNRRSSFLWWYYAKKTCFYEKFLSDNLNKNKKNINIIQQIQGFIRSLKRDCRIKEEYKRIQKLIKNKKICFWGASIFLEEFLYNEKIDKKNVLGIIDKDLSKQGTIIKGFEVYSADDLNKLKPDYILLTIKNSQSRIYRELDDFLNKNYPNIKLLPNIFENKIKRSQNG